MTRAFDWRKTGKGKQGRVITANRKDTCTNCTTGIYPGQQMVWKYGGWCHLRCAQVHTNREPRQNDPKVRTYHASQLPADSKLRRH